MQVRLASGLVTSPILQTAGKNEVDSLRFSGERVSVKPILNHNKLRMAKQKLMVAAAENGCIPKKTNSDPDQSHWEAIPPIAGPSTNPNPKAIPTKAMPLDRFSREVTSAIAAVATEIFPPAIPPIRRERTRSQKFPDMIQRKYPIAVPKRVNIKIGRAHV